MRHEQILMAHVLMTMGAHDNPSSSWGVMTTTFSGFMAATGYIWVLLRLPYLQLRICVSASKSCQNQTMMSKSDKPVPQKRVRRHFRDLHPSVRKDIHDSINQIVALGSEMKYFSQYHQEPRSVNRSERKQRSKRRRRLYKQLGEGVLKHSEDILLYSRIHDFVKHDTRRMHELLNDQRRDKTYMKTEEPQPVSMFTFPYTEEKETQIYNGKDDDQHHIDAGWEELYGDGISEKEFRDSLSRHKNCGADNSSCNGWIPSNSNKEKDDVLQDIIENAWQRAVHMASTTMNVAGAKENNEATKVADDEMKVDGCEKDDILNGTGADKERKSLELNQDDGWKSDDQYHERRTLMENILKVEATNVIDSILERVLTYISKQQDLKKDEKPFRWSDIVDCFYTFVQDMEASGDTIEVREVRTADERITQTVQINSNLLPIPLNAIVVDNAIGRLRHRYDANARDSIL